MAFPSFALTMTPSATLAALTARLGPDTYLPDLDNDLTVLARRLLAYFAHGGSVAGGGCAATVPLSGRIVVLLVIDGLGLNYLAGQGAGSFLARHLLGSISSVFPSTTASAITTLMTGLPPVSHGLTGWFIRDARFGGIVAPLPLAVRGNGPVHASRLTQRLFPYSTLFQRLKVPSVVVSPQEIAGSPFNRRHSRGACRLAYAGLPGWLAGIEAGVEHLGSGGGYVYGYCPDFDSLAHAYGVASQKVAGAFGFIDRSVEVLARRLRGLGVDLLLTADHGFQDLGPGRVLNLEDWPEVLALLAGPLWGERRVVWCQARPGCEKALVEALGQRLGERGVVVASDALLAADMLGRGRPSRRIGERVGSHAILMASGWALRDWVAGERAHPMVGYHGGLSRGEMEVPLVLLPA